MLNGKNEIQKILGMLVVGLVPKLFGFIALSFLPVLVFNPLF